MQKALEQLTSDVEGLVEARRQTMDVPPADESTVEKARFSMRSLRSLRRRLDLTQQECARLLEVSPVTITSWETGKSRPRKNNLALFVTLRDMGREDVDKALGRHAALPPMAAEDVKKLRQQLNLTQAELALKVGVTSAAVTLWETGRSRPSRKVRAKIAELTASAPAAEVGQPEGAGVRETPTLTPAGIRDIRGRLGLSQEDLAARLGVSANTVYNWESGRTAPRQRNMSQLLAL
jgi:DNA-binding transcriptional regulator YiaG